MTNKGFTLIELLVVISIVVIMGALMVPRLLKFKDTQDLTDEAAKLQTALKLVQNNAQSGFSCGDSFNPTQKAIDWRIMTTTDFYVLSPNCSNGAQPLPSTRTTFPSDIRICAVVYDSGGNFTFPTNCTSQITIITFKNLTGAVNFEDLNYRNRTRVAFVLRSSDTNSMIPVFVEKGGLIYVGNSQ